MGMYHPAAAGDLNPVHLVVHASGEAPSFGPILRALAVEVDPALRLHDLVTLDQVTQGQQEFFAFWWAVLLSVTAMALLLSLGGIFAVMSFTVTRRSREIGIRVALGSSRPRVVATVLRRPLVQIALGLATGSLVLAALLFGLGEVDPTLASISRIFAYAGIIGLVLLLASISPALRALGVDPGEALRVE
jgi:ABC-type antimicrobial peptide transport system permease subunit